jgi:riboflavin kinase / FMN adenylyltransferase
MKNFISIGTFDGVHKGHRKLLETLDSKAEKANMASLVLYFPLSPKDTFKNEKNMTMITLPNERENLIESLGIDRVQKLNFDRKFSKIQAEDFFNRILLEKYHMQGLIVGKDFAFGKNREGHIPFLRKKCRELNIPLSIMPFYCHKGHKISSSVIKPLLKEGHIEEVNRMLGYDYKVEGKIVKGKSFGRKIGFPTINLSVDKRKILPTGVFIVRATHEGKRHLGVCNIGFRPTLNPIKGDVPIVEIHLLGFSKTLTKGNFRFEILSKIRNEKKFRSHKELTTAISNDVDFLKHHSKRYF